MDFFEAATRGVQRAFCRALDGTDNYFGFWGSLGIGPGEVPPSWKKWVCNEDGPEPPAPPFEGGQCETTYRMGISYENCFTEMPAGATETVAVMGPITSVTTTDIGASNPCGRRIEVTLSGPNDSGTSTFAFAPDENITTGLFRTDGMPDDCGDPPVVTPTFPPGGIQEPDTIDYDGPNGPESDPVTITINAPIIIPIIPFTVYAPVTITGPNINFTGNFEIAPEIVFRPNFGGGDSSPGEPVGTAPPEDPDSAPSTPEDEEDEELIGILVRSQISSETRTTELDGQMAPDLFIPRIASVYFRTRNRGRLGWNGPHDVKTTSTYVPVPPNTYAIDARITYEQGWSGGFFRIFGTRRDS